MSLGHHYGNLVGLNANSGTFRTIDVYFSFYITPGSCCCFSCCYLFVCFIISCNNSKNYIKVVQIFINPFAVLLRKVFQILTSKRSLVIRGWTTFLSNCSDDYNEVEIIKERTCYFLIFYITWTTYHKIAS